MQQQRPSTEKMNKQIKLYFLKRIHSKALIQIRWRNQKLYRQAKAKRIQHHQTSFTTITKGNSLGNKHKRREQKRNKRKKNCQKKNQSK